MTQSGFLSDYARLKPTSWGEGVECWRDPNLDAARYDKILVSRILVSLKASKAPQTIDPKDLNTLTDYFHHDLVKALQPQMRVVDQAGPGVVVMRVALTDLVPTTVTDSLAGTLIPYAFVAEAGSGVATGRPAGSTPYMGETGMEMQFRDGGSGKVPRRMPRHRDWPQVRGRRQYQRRRRGADLGQWLSEFLPGLDLRQGRLRQVVAAGGQAYRSTARTFSAAQRLVLPRRCRMVAADQRDVGRCPVGAVEGLSKRRRRRIRPTAWYLRWAGSAPQPSPISAAVQAIDRCARRR
jgi:hypothetical protein